MARDYAKYRAATNKRNVAKQGWRGRLLLVFFVLCVVSIIIFGCCIYKNSMKNRVKIDSMGTYKNNMTSWVEQMKLLLSHPMSHPMSHPKKTNEGSQAKKPISKRAAPEPDIHFSFYTELPNMHVMLLKQ